MTELLTTALALAERGIPVIPCWPLGKEPVTKHGLLEATTKPALIRDVWTRHPDCNLAIRTGEPSGLVVLDIDPDKGGDESLRLLEREHGLLPATTSTTTPRGGSHFFFRWPGMVVKNSASDIADGVDFRGDGGYVLAPPSRTAHGRWEWDEFRQAAPMPPWLIEVTTTYQADGQVRAKPPEVWFRLISAGLVKGARDDGLTRLAGHLLGWQHDVHVDVVTELLHAVNEARCEPPLPRKQVEKIIDSIAGREARRR